MVRNRAVEKVTTEDVAPPPREFISDPVMLKFLGLPDMGKLLESRLEEALMANLRRFCCNEVKILS
jgi:predicted nuclease of restriction endonuclease-like (RecB) superfamily